MFHSCLIFVVTDLETFRHGISIIFQPIALTVCTNQRVGSAEHLNNCYHSNRIPDVAIPLYENFVNTLSRKHTKEVFTGEFGADMKVRLLNDGPVTITIDSKNRE